MMRTLTNIFWLILAFVLASGCGSSVEADFQMEKKEAVVSEGITFTNQSKNASRYRWEMGDGTTFEVSKPYQRTFTYAYKNKGTYEVTLTAFNGGSQDKVTKVIEIPNAKYLLSLRLHEAPPSEDFLSKADYTFSLESDYKNHSTRTYWEVEESDYPLHYQDSMGTVLLTDQEWTIKLIEDTRGGSGSVVSKWTFNGLDKEGQNDIFTLTDNPRDTFQVKVDVCYTYR